MRRALFLFDFDHTIVKFNTDTWFHRLVGGIIPQHIKQYEKQDWRQYVQECLKYVSSQGVSLEQVKQCIEMMELTDKIEHVITDKADNIIISDSNFHFIKWVVDKQNWQNRFKKIITNPSREDHEKQLLVVEPYTYKHNCKSCRWNICKQEALLKELNWAEIRKQYVRIFYFGDGKNDYCAAKLLNENDTLFARKGFELEKKIKQNPLPCNVVIWESGDDIVQSKYYKELNKILLF